MTVKKPVGEPILPKNYVEPFAFDILWIDSKIGRWSHPKASTYVKSMEDLCDNSNPDDSVYGGNILRVHFSNEVPNSNDIFGLGSMCTVVAIFGKKEFKTILKHIWNSPSFDMTKKSKWKEMAKKQSTDSVIGLLAGDYWRPGGEQFYFSDFGQALNNEINFYSKELYYSLSPDVGLDYKNGIFTSYST